ncbi:uncharacterized protein [Montipora foliosa]|uniref:uncharacterized protein n=1 Tax=Montipora foliosa TaxID=591990 RepID=UPI0035F1A25D
MLRRKIEEQFPQLEWRLFEYMKACYGELVKPKLAEGVQMTGSLLLKLMGQGAVYIRALESLGDDDDDDDDIDLMTAAWEIEDSFACDTSSTTAITATSRGQSGQVSSVPQESRDSAAGPSFCNPMQDSSEDVIEVLSPGEGLDGTLGNAAVSSDDHHTDFEAQFDELPIKPILLHRAQLRQDFIMEFSDPNILKFKLDVTVVDEMGKEEIGSGNGVLRDAISEFWRLFFLAATIGAAEKVPFIRHDFKKNEWEAVGRVFVYSFVHLSYLPLQLSPAFIMTCLFEDEALTNDLLLASFRFYVSSDDRDMLANCIAGNVHANDDELLDFLSSFKCYRNPTEQNIREIILEIAHQEIVQKPRFVANCWSPLFIKLRKLIKTSDDLTKLYEERKPTPKKVVKLLVASPENDAERCCLDHLKRYLKSLEGNISNFLRFVTGSDILTCTSIKVTFNTLEGLIRRPVAHMWPNFGTTNHLSIL